MTSNQPQLLIDTDAFCKLATASLLDAALALLGVSKAQCARRPALIAMLTRGRLHQKYGEAVCAKLRPVATTLPIMPEASPALLDSMNSIEDLDVGEAELFAVAAERRLRVFTADKRAVKAVAKVPAIQVKLDGLVVTLEALMLGLTTLLDDAALRVCGKQMAAYDQMARAVFSSPSTPLKDALGSYLASYEGDSKPMQLWKPS